MAYATISDLDKYGIQTAALEDLASPTKQAALDSTAEIMDSYFRARYPDLETAVPGWTSFDSWGEDVVRVNAILATYDLMVVRGYNPAAGADIALRDRYLDAIRWLERVARQEAQANLKPKQHDAADYDSPGVATYEMRGW